MNKPKGDKGHGRRGKGQARGNGPRARVRARASHKPGILESWEDFNETAMQEYLAAVVEDFGEQMDALEEALRSEN